MKIIFDECMPPKWCRRLAEMLALRKQPIECVHLLEQIKHGTKDDQVVQWLLGFARPMVVVSGDSGAQSKRNEPRLALLCPAAGIPSVFISPKLCQSEGFEKIRMVVYCLPHILEVMAGNPTDRYRLEAHDKGYRVRPWPMPEGVDGPAPGDPRGDAPQPPAE